MKLSNPRNNDFEKKLKSIFGKSFDEDDIEKFSSSGDGLIKKNKRKISNNEGRTNKTLEKNNQKKLRKGFFCNLLI